jgi:hypothetical protein
MTFLTGGFLAGLALTSVPVVIHLIIRRRRKLVPWGAMQFLTGTPPRFRQRLMKLNELLVLLLRILAITAVVLAFAQPLMFSGVLARRTGETVFIVDASLSTARLSSASGTAFAEEITAAEKALDALGEQDTVRVLVASDAPRWLTPAPLQATAGNREAVRSMLHALQPTDGGSDMALAIAEVLQAPPAADRNARRVVIFTDATERPWHAADVTRWRAIQKAVTGATVPTVIEVAAAAPPNPATLANLTISRLTADHDTVAVGDSVLLTAEVRNGGANSSLATEVLWQLDGVDAGRMPLPPLGKGVSTTLEFSIPCGGVGSHIARASLAMADDLPADSAAAVAIRTLDEIPVLVVDGGRKANSTDMPETGFFLAALGQLPGVREPAKARAAFQPKVIEPAELTKLPLDPFLCVVLADVEAVDLQAATRLATHVAMGGGLWLALGDRTNTDKFNEVFASSAIGLSPVRLGAPTREVSETSPGWRVLPPTEPHPATALLGDTKQLDIDKARVRRHHTMLPPVPGNLGVLLKLESQSPLVIEHTFGKGRVILQMASLDRAWSNLPILQAYVPMVREFLWRLVDGRVSRRNIAPGETLRIGANTSSESSFEVKLPDGQTSSGSADEAQIRFSGTFLPGIYRVERVNQAPELFSVPRPPAESDLAAVSDATRRFVSEHGAIFGDAASGGTGETATVRERKSIAPALLACALALFILEALLTLLFARQRKVRHGAVVLTPITTR